MKYLSVSVKIDVKCFATLSLKDGPREAHSPDDLLPSLRNFNRRVAGMHVFEQK